MLETFQNHAKLMRDHNNAIMLHDMDIEMLYDVIKHLEERVNELEGNRRDRGCSPEEPTRGY